jgi:hypothetical protein
MAKSAAPFNELSCLVVINRRSGTVRWRGAEAVRDMVELALADTFHPLILKLVDGDVLPEIEIALKEGTADVVIAGGGDGTISSAAESWGFAFGNHELVCTRAWLQPGAGTSFGANQRC